MVDLKSKRLDGTLFIKREITLADNVNANEIILQVFEQEINHVKFEIDSITSFKRVKVFASGSKKSLRFVSGCEQLMNNKTESINNNINAPGPSQSPNNADIDDVFVVLKNNQFANKN